MSRVRVIDYPGGLQKVTSLPPAAVKARVKAKDPSSLAAMNQLERRYARFLDGEVAAGRVVKWRFQPFSIRLAPNTFSRPDFLIQMADGTLEIHEVKGPHVWEDSRVKSKLCAELWPEFTWRWVTERPAKSGHFNAEVLG